MHIYVCMYKVCCAQLLFCTHTALEIISLQFLAVSIRQWDLAWINCDCRLWQITCFPLFFIRLKLQITVCPNSITISFLCHRFGCSVWEHFGLLYRDLLKDVHSWEGHPCQEFRVSLTLIFYLIWKYIWKGEHIYFISIPANTLSPVRLHYLNNKDMLKGKIIWWQFISTDHSSNMTNINLLKITLRVSLYIRQRKKSLFLARKSYCFRDLQQHWRWLHGRSNLPGWQYNLYSYLVRFYFCLFFFLKLQLEYTARLDFLWRVQAKEEINEMKELREHNENMLRNILPSHVARHFLEKDRDNEVCVNFLIFLSNQ